MFIVPVVDDITMNVDIHKKNLKSVAFYQIVGFFTSLILSCYVSTWKDIVLIGLSQLSIIITSSWSIADYLTANESEFGLYEHPVERRNEDDKVDSEAPDADLSVEDIMEPGKELSITTCKICLRGFSENLKGGAPLMLSCGHTMCWKCCKEVRKQNFNLSVACPFCRKATYTRSLKELPKNYAIMEMIQMKNQGRLFEI